MGVFGDRDLKKLKDELEMGRFIFKIGPQVGVDRFKMGADNTGRAVLGAARRLAGQGRRDEAVGLLRSARVADPVGAEDLWNRMLGLVLEDLGASDGAPAAAPPPLPPGDE